jgi:phosphatidylinositol alpha-1,6-mannosyltransferase
VVLSGHIVCSPAAILLRHALRIPYVQYLYADEITASRRLAASAMRHAARSIVISGHTRSLALGAGGAPSDLELIHPGVDAPPAVARSRRSRPTILTVASMNERYKGHDVLIRALPLIRAHVPDVEWVVVGGGRLEPTYRAIVRDRGLEHHVRFCGRVSSAERDRWLDSADVFAMPSRLRGASGGGEGFGIVFVEASAHGLPVVAGGVGGARDAVSDGETGFLVDPGDHVAVADAVCRLLLDEALRERMGTAGVAFARGFRWAEASRRVEALLAQAA